jgi:hypothetical protein
MALEENCKYFLYGGRGRERKNWLRNVAMSNFPGEI